MILRMKAGYQPIDIKFADWIVHYNAFHEGHIKNSLLAVENLFAGYIKDRLDMYLNMLQD